MKKFQMILPNLLVLTCAVILFHRTFLSGSPSWIGSLVTLSPLLALAYCVTGNMPKLVSILTVVLNAILFFACGYAFLGIANMLAKNGMLSGAFYAVTGILWAASLGMLCIRRSKPAALCALTVNLVLSAAGAIGLYAYLTSGWKPGMTAVLFGALVAVAGLNVGLLGKPFFFLLLPKKKGDGNTVAL